MFFDIFNDSLGEDAHIISSGFEMMAPNTQFTAIRNIKELETVFTGYAPDYNDPFILMLNLEQTVIINV